MGDVRDELARTIGVALAAATVMEDGEEYVDWNRWEHCRECPNKGKPCPCSGEPYAPEIADAVMPLLAHARAQALRDAAETIPEVGDVLRGMAARVEAGDAP
jgi:hypothetical protein